MEQVKKSKKTIWLTSAVGACLAALTCSLVIYGEIKRQEETMKMPSPAQTLAGSYESAQPPQSVQIGGTQDNGVVYGGFAWGTLKVGYVGKNKIIKESAEVNIPRLGSDKYGLIETNVTVKRLGETGSVVETLQGKALVFANIRDTVDAGYILVSYSEAQSWVKVLNGNPGYVFDSSRSNIYPYVIREPITGTEFTAYNLAEIAVACGGAGDPPPGDGLTKIRDDLYMKRDGFKATPRPTGAISVAPPPPVTNPANAVTRSLAPQTEAAAPAMLRSSKPQGRFIDASGNTVDDKLVLFFAESDKPGKYNPIAISTTTDKVYRVSKLDKATWTATLGEAIGQVTRMEGDDLYFVPFNPSPELQGLEIKMKRIPAPL